MEGLNIGIIGCGNMGGAIVRGMVNAGSNSFGTLYIYDTDTKKSAGLADETGCVVADLADLVKQSAVLVFAVKPQNFDDLVGEIAPHITEQTVVSVMAGIRISNIIKKLGKEVPVVRAMPNMAAFVGESITCISCNSLVKIIEEVKEIFSGIGRVVEIEEEFMDSVTAVSGSGPAYLFYLADAMIKAGIKAGLGEDKARELVVQTIYGSAKLLRNTDDSPEELIKKVASKGGTTEAALSVFDERDMQSIVVDAIQKAKQRSEELAS